MALAEKKTILAIETSCDETAAAVLSVADGQKWPQIKTLSSIIKSQIKLHSKMGGVVPEAAARAHVKWIRSVVKQALKAISYKLEAVDYIAVTVGPGLIPSLIVGVEFAKALSFATKTPIIPVNHLSGHLYSPFGREFSIFNFQFPNISLIASGGHTILTLMKNEKEYKILGQTLDDAAGEAFDKVAKLLKLPYPGGPEVAKLAKMGKPIINFPRPMINQKNYNFSFAGLKTSVLYYLQSLSTKHSRLHLPSARADGGQVALSTKQDICASFQQAVVDVLVTKTLRAAKEFKAKSISLSGGVSANLKLRNQLRNSCAKENLNFFVPPINLTTDNAEMIGIAAAFMLHNGFKPKSYKQIQPDSNLYL